MDGEAMVQKRDRAWWEVGSDWWAQVPRMVAPTLILVLVLLCIPALRRHPSKI